jgi:tetratricopeptide (TPR) repeat protein
MKRWSIELIRSKIIAQKAVLKARIVMSNDAITEAVQLYREAGRLFRENKRLTREAMSAFQAREGKSTPPSLWVENAAGNASEMERLLERIISLGDEDEALRRHSVYALAHRNLGLFFSRRFKSFSESYPGYLEDVAAHLNTALKLGVKRDRKLARTMGAAYYQTGKLREAVEPLKESIEANPNDSVARYQLCLTYLGLHEREKAREQFEALKQNPSSADYQLVKMLEPMMERKGQPVDEAEREELMRELDNFRRIHE